MSKKEEKSWKKAVQGWRDLAADERRRPSWDSYYLPAMAAYKANLYENTAKSMEQHRATGIPHCACHLLPTSRCAELAQVRMRELRR